MAPGDLTPEWLTTALIDSGVLRHGRVTEARWQRVGQSYGFTGIIGRVRLRYENPGGEAPASLIAKLPMAMDADVSGYRRAQERDPEQIHRYYERCEREARFYRETPVAFAPTLYYAAADREHRRVILLLEDVAGGRQGDVLQGCSVEDAMLVIDHVAPFHANWWGNRSVAYGFTRSGPDPQSRQRRYAVRVDQLVDVYGARIPQEVLELAEQLRSRLGAVAAALEARSQTIVHGDLHLDNMIFDACDRGRSVTVLDWQTISLGSPAWDMAMFLSGSLSVEDRRAAEGDLLDRYVSQLSGHGVSDYSLEGLRQEYRLALLLLLAGTLHWLSAVDYGEATSRERALQEDALAADGRLMTAVLDHDPAALLRAL